MSFAPLLRIGFFVKWISGGLGWYFGGPLGGVLGFIAGSVFDSFDIHIFKKPGKRKVLGDFSVSLLVLIAAVMKADGKVLKSELDYVKHFLLQNFGQKEAPEALGILKELLQQELPLTDSCNRVRLNIDYSSRLQLMHFLYNLANIDGHATDSEQVVLDRITRGLGVVVSEKRSVGSVITSQASIEAAYRVLGIPRSANVLDIKKAYRAMAVRYHPDKVAYLGEEMKQVAKEKFQQLTQAYETVKKEKNFV